MIGTEAETHNNALRSVPEEVLTEHLDKDSYNNSLKPIPEEVLIEHLVKDTYKSTIKPIPEEVLIEHLDEDVNPSTGNLPSSVDLSTSKYFPAIQDQGWNLGSCAAFSAVYYQFSYEANKLNDIDSKDLSNCYSPKWAYNSLNGGTKDGISLEESYDFLRDYGSLRWADFPYDKGEDLDNDKGAYMTLPGKEYADKMREALKCRLSNWDSYKIQGTGTAITNNKDEDLNKVKSVLAQGHPLAVQMNNDRELHESLEWGCVIVSCASNGMGHVMTVVGYNDDVWVDANGNGDKDIGECGAFKLANSFGTDDEDTNDGYVWVLYDALNGESSIPDYKRKDGKERVPMFSLKTADNYFMSMEVENKRVGFVAEVNFSADALSQLELSYGKSEKSTNGCKLYHDFGNYGLNRPSAYNKGVALIDMENAMNSIATDYRGYKWYLKVGDNNNDRQFIRNISYKVTDNLGQTIADAGSIPSLDGATKTLSAGIDLMVGDVDYSGTIDSDDAVLVLQYFVGLKELSNVQMFLGDFNGDGKVNSDDAQLILSHFAGM